MGNNQRAHASLDITCNDPDALLSITFPFMQTRRDALGCDAMCQGGQTSLRSALGLVGASLVGRLSDTIGRVPMLWVGLLATFGGLSINMTMDTLEGMWLAIVVQPPRTR